MSTEALAHVVGAVMSFVAFAMWLPQASLVWKNRKDPEKLQGISLATQGLVLLNATGWGLYAILTGAFWSGAPGIVNAPLALLTIILCLRARKPAPPLAAGA